MEAHEYQTLFDFESSYWWYRALHGVLIDTLRDLGVGSADRVLDAGCGTGQNLRNVGDLVTPDGYGFDLSRDAAPFWAGRGLSRVCLASINEIPFHSGAFDAAMSVDVLECDAVGEEQAYGELWRVVRPGGHVVLVVPAYDWLMTPEHHRAVHASRRYTRNKLRSLLLTRPVDVVRITHVFASLFPAVAAYRLALRYLFPPPNGEPRSELRPLSPRVNSMLLRVMEVERRLLRSRDLPFGSSILAVVRKAGRR